MIITSEVEWSAVSLGGNNGVFIKDVIATNLRFCIHVAKVSSRKGRGRFVFWHSYWFDLSVVLRRSLLGVRMAIARTRFVRSMLYM
jgi:hypothetical protein